MLTEICPAISFAWEPAESNVMERPPRDRQTDRLVRPSLLAYSYLQAGIVEAGIALIAYLLVFVSNGVPLSALPGFAAGTSDAVLTLPSGRLMGHEEQVSLATMAATAFYINLILSQVFNLFATKTRFVSLTDQGLFSNAMMIYGMFVAMGIMFFISYVPGVHTMFGTYPRLSIIYYLPSLVSGFVLLTWSEVRKAIASMTHEDHWFHHCFVW